MKQYELNREGIWIEKVQIPLTSEQISSRNFIKTNEQKDVSAKKAKELNAFYESVKPILQEKDTYQLLSINVNENFNGILNCRINQEHKQTRF